ncbi:hypothetical protein OG21DRAFT_1603520 [Imleria badia]|nr:hypothetical protein OG21DRAFT_1603520 [Imleria badia]
MAKKRYLYAYDKQLKCLRVYVSSIPKRTSVRTSESKHQGRHRILANGTVEGNVYDWMELAQARAEERQHCRNSRHLGVGFRDRDEEWQFEMRRKKKKPTLSGANTHVPVTSKACQGQALSSASATQETIQTQLRLQCNVTVKLSVGSPWPALTRTPSHSQQRRGDDDDMTIVPYNSVISDPLPSEDAERNAPGGDKTF